MKNFPEKISLNISDLFYGAIGAFVGTMSGVALTSFVLYLILSHVSVLK